MLDGTCWNCSHQIVRAGGFADDPVWVHRQPKVGETCLDPQPEVEQGGTPDGEADAT